MKKFTISVLLKGKEAYCNGLYDLESNNLKVLAGSKIRKSWSPNFKYFNKRNTQIKEYCIDNGTDLVLQKDLVFDTPTAAAKLCMGYEVHGQIYWRTTYNVKITDCLKK